MNYKKLYAEYTLGQEEAMPGDMTPSAGGPEDAAAAESFPCGVIVTNLAPAVFDEGSAARREFEATFCAYGAEAAFMYLRSFRRARVTYELPESAALARIDMHRAECAGATVNVYFAQPPMRLSEAEAGSGHHLAPPPLEKQFLISPPASPPCGWTQEREAPPIRLDTDSLGRGAGSGGVGVGSGAGSDNSAASNGAPHLPHLVNYDLLGALATLAPGQVTELHPPGEGGKPSIVVHAADDGGGGPREDAGSGSGSGSNSPALRPRIVQTRCPSRTSVE